jgi:hypothetical protein
VPFFKNEDFEENCIINYPYININIESMIGKNDKFSHDLRGNRCIVVPEWNKYMKGNTYPPNPTSLK